MVVAEPEAARAGAGALCGALGRGVVAVGAEPVGLDGAVEADAVRVVGRVALVADEDEPLLVVASPPHETQGSVDLALSNQSGKQSASMGM